MTMADNQTDLGGLETQFVGLEDSLSGLGIVASTFQRELGGMQDSMKDAGREAASMSRSVSKSFKAAFESVVFDGKGLKDALTGLGRSLSASMLNKAVAPVQDSVGSVVGSGLKSVLGGLLAFEKGAAFRGGRISTFAQGGVVSAPTHFPMRGGTGLMGEAGPEAIMPLARGADGKLGVRGAQGGGGAVHVTMHVSSPDVGGFARSQSQIAAEMSRAIQRGRRNL